MKKYIYIVFSYIMFAATYMASAQTFYPIPDANLRKRLIDSFPSLMNAQGELNIQAAKTVSKDLNLDAIGITNADGIQFFESTGILRIRNNKLTSLPQLSSMKGLRRIYVNGNKVTQIPDLSALYQLIDLYVVNNNITSFAGSRIEEKTTLQFLSCSGNKITALPDLSKLTLLKTLSVDHNPLTNLPNLSFNTALQQLDIGNTYINSVPSLPLLLNLERFNCDNTNMTDISGLSDNNKLIKLSTENSLITKLPNFDNKPNLTTVTIYNNYLTFEDLIPLTYLPAAIFAGFTYSPQKDVKLPLYVDVRESNNYTYQLSIDASITTNQYTWLKNNIAVQPPNATGDYILSPVFMGDSGFYSAEVRNPALPALVLKSNTSKLIVRPCMEINAINLNILSSDCREGALIDIAGTTVDGAVLPITYTLQSQSSATNILGSTATQFTNVIPGTYVLCVTDSRNCTAAKNFYLDKGADCESVFSPNGDGIMDNYFIPDTGTAQIYTATKKLIKTMQVPAAWDGTTDNGGLADAGYYVIIINGSSSVGVSLMR